MPPKIYSRHLLTAGVTHDESETQRVSPCGAAAALNTKYVDTLWLTDRVPFRYTNLPDNTTHVVGQGDTLWGLAGRYFKGLPRPSGLWWIIADFQIEPIFDPTIQLAPGSTLIIPSLRTVIEDIFDERRRALGVSIE